MSRSAPFAVAAACILAVLPARAAELSFNKDVRPILV